MAATYSLEGDGPLVMRWTKLYMWLLPMSLLLLNVCVVVYIIIVLQGVFRSCTHAGLQIATNQMCATWVCRWWKGWGYEAAAPPHFKGAPWDFNFLSKKYFLSSKIISSATACLDLYDHGGSRHFLACKAARRLKGHLTVAVEAFPFLDSQLG